MDRKKLKEYKEKRNFSKTAEPDAAKKGDIPQNIFVVQKHDAQNLHYDFRLRIGEVLKSWVIPKGPSVNPKDRRLAMETEDHPLEYVNFEGIIPENQYGSGTVIVWDQGKYENLRVGKEKDDADMNVAYNEGKIEIKLKGEKLRGGYALIRTGKKNEGKWMLIKMKDEDADARRKPLKTEPESVLSGKTIKEVNDELK